MAFEVKINFELSKQDKYEQLLPQINSLITGEDNAIANLANITSVLKYAFEDFLWVGFYFLEIKKNGEKVNEKNSELVLGPFQGRVACVRIPFGKGVCGTAAQKKETIIVDDVDKFPGHIVCDSLSKSEIVIPVIKNGKSIGVLDIDSDRPANFDLTDKKYLEQLVLNIMHLF